MIFYMKVKRSEIFRLTHLSCVKFFRNYKITKIIMINNYANEIIVIL